MGRFRLLILLWWAAAPVAHGHDSIARVYEAVSPSVVVVRAQGRSLPTQPGEQPVSLGNLGTGVLISETGRVLTAAHVVEVTEGVEVEFNNGAVVGARVVSVSTLADSALLQLESVPEGARVAPLGDSDRARVGDAVFIIGTPYGVSQSLSVGHISGRRQARQQVSSRRVQLLQTDAAINLGNSGGGLFDMDGRVVGIVSQILSRSGAHEGLGFAVAINTVREFLLERRPFWSGLAVVQISGDMARALNLPQAGGLLVQQVARGSPGERAGLKAGTIPVHIGEHSLVLGGDVILAVGDISLGDAGGYDRALDSLDRIPPGQAVKLTVLRSGQLLELSFSPDDR